MILARHGNCGLGFVNGFSIWVGAGAVLGLWRVARNASQRSPETWVNAGLLILFASLAGARLFYAWMNRGYFSSHLIEVPQVWLGGLSWPGAAAGAWLAFLYLSNRMKGTNDRRISPGRLGDQLYPLLPPLCVSIWLGSWLAGSAYGTSSQACAWWSAPSMDESGAYSCRFPLQALAAFSLVVFFWFLETRKWPEGILPALAVAGVLVHYSLVSFLVAEPAPTWNGLRVDTWMAFLFLACLTVYVLGTGLTAYQRKN